MVTINSSVTGNVVVAGQIIPSWTVSGNATGGQILNNFIGGFTLSNDSISPNAVLDISAGCCADSTNAVYINLASAITKNTAGTWVEGTGQAGMGNGLTVANSTTYHVFAIIDVNGNADVYFDTDAGAANAPTGTQNFRRIGSFITSAAGIIKTFLQQGNFFYINGVTSLNTTMGSVTGAILTTDVPTGVSVIPLLSWEGQITATAGGSATTNVTSGNFSGTLLLQSVMFLQCQASQNSTGGFAVVLGPATDLSARIRYSITSSGAGAFASSSLTVFTVGWIDSRGQ